MDAQVVKYGPADDFSDGYRCSLRKPRFIKFYGISGPPYRSWIKTGFRIFFALCSLGAAIDLRRRLLEGTRPGKFYWGALVVAAAWFTVIVLLVKTVEWVAGKRRGNFTASK